MGNAEAIGISCGGPLDAERGIIMSPPNLPGWDDIHITEMLSEALGAPAYLENDANACALAEWKFGAGVGCRNMAFLTFGTGLGAGLILDGRLYSGFSGMAGEIGHVRMTEDGPIGYGKRGSVEGYCSGGGIAQLGKSLAREALLSGKALPYCKTDADLDTINARLLAEWARRGDETAREVYRISGEMLGKSLAILIDILNPERIVIGSIFARAEDLLRPPMERTLAEEAIGISLDACKILPAALGDEIGDFAALAIAETKGANNNGR
jgi:glucokinase